MGRRGRKISERSDGVKAALAAAATDNLEDMCSYLTAAGSVNAANKDGVAALHVAAAAGSMTCLAWLLAQDDIALNLRDVLTRATPLHHALHFGQIAAAIELIRKGADFTTNLDRMNRSPQDLVTEEISEYTGQGVGHAHKALSAAASSESAHENMWSGLENEGEREDEDDSKPTMDSCTLLYTWGSNKNFTLGHSSDTSRTKPQLVALGKLEAPQSVRAISCSKYHMLALTDAGQVFSWGFGRLGRLGNNTEEVALKPQALRSHNTWVAVATGRDHSLLLSEDGDVYGCGSNAQGQLGMPGVAQVLVPTCIKNLKKTRITGISASGVHSAAWNSHSLYTFGTNQGQLGFPKGEERQESPRKVSLFQASDVIITDVSCSDFMTAVITSAGQVFVFRDYLVNKFTCPSAGIPSFLAFKKPFFCKIATTKHNGLVALSQTGRVYVWNGRGFDALAWAHGHDLHVVDVAVGCHEPGTLRLMLVTDKGYLYEAAWVAAAGPGAVVKPTRVPHIVNVSSVRCDPSGDNFAVMRYSPKYCLSEEDRRAFAVALDTNLGNAHSRMLDGALMSMDDFVDVFFRLDDGDVVGAHRFVLCQHSRYFAGSLAPKPPKTTVALEGVDRPTLEALLRFLYTGQIVAPAQQDGEDESAPNSAAADLAEILPKLARAAHRLNLPGLERLCSAMGVESKHAATDEPAYIGGEDARRVDGVARGGHNAPEDGAEAAAASKSHTAEAGQRQISRTFALANANSAGAGAPKTRHFADAVVSAGGISIPCHCAMLASRCEYFTIRLQTYWHTMAAGAGNGGEGKVVLTLPCEVSRGAAAALVDFIYDNKVDFEERTLNDVFEIIALADAVLLDDLRRLCELEIVHRVNVTSVIPILEASILFNAEVLSGVCTELACWEMPSLLHARMLDALDAGTVARIERQYQSYLPVREWILHTEDEGGHGADSDIRRAGASGAYDLAEALELSLLDISRGDASNDRSSTSSDEEEEEEESEEGEEGAREQGKTEEKTGGGKARAKETARDGVQSKQTTTQALERAPAHDEDDLLATSPATTAATATPTSGGKKKGKRAQYTKIVGLGTVTPEKMPVVSGTSATGPPLRTASEPVAAKKSPWKTLAEDKDPASSPVVPSGLSPKVFPAPWLASPPERAPLVSSSPAVPLSADATRFPKTPSPLKAPVSPVVPASMVSPSKPSPAATPSAAARAVPVGRSVSAPAPGDGAAVLGRTPPPEPLACMDLTGASGRKLSQRERKAMEKAMKEQAAQAALHGPAMPSPAKERPNAWGSAPRSNEKPAAIGQLQREEARGRGGGGGGGSGGGGGGSISATSGSVAMTSAAAVQRPLSAASSAAALGTSPVGVGLGTSPKVSLHAILREQEDARKAALREVRKPVRAIQIEERAIEELRAMYTSGDYLEEEQFVRISRQPSMRAK